jgi:hypothetical protein
MQYFIRIFPTITHNWFHPMGAGRPVGGCSSKYSQIGFEHFLPYRKIELPGVFLLVGLFVERSRRWRHVP